MTCEKCGKRYGWSVSPNYDPSRGACRACVRQMLAKAEHEHIERLFAAAKSSNKEKFRLTDEQCWSGIGSTLSDFKRLHTEESGRC